MKEMSHKIQDLFSFNLYCHRLVILKAGESKDSCGRARKMFLKLRENPAIERLFYQTVDENVGLWKSLGEVR